MSIPPTSNLSSGYSSDCSSDSEPSYTYARTTTFLTTHMEHDNCPLAEVKIPTKVKDCPMLSSGHINSEIFYNWGIACKLAWYHVDLARIDGLSLDAYLLELAKLVLPRNWAVKVRNQILSSTQGTKCFMNWKIELENLNAILTTTSPIHALDKSTVLKAHLEANMNTDLLFSIEEEELLCTSTDFTEWAQEVSDRDDRLHGEHIRTQHLIDQSQNVRSVKHAEKKDLLSCLSDDNSVKTSSNHSGSSNATDKKYLPKLTDSEKKLLNEHEGCACCRTFYAGHRSDTCPMKKSNTWPDAFSYTSLTKAMAKAAVPHLTAGATQMATSYSNDDTDLYVATPHVSAPFSLPHMCAVFDMTGPSISDFPISVTSLLDIGCPSIVISLSLIDKLGLRCCPLPTSEDNLSSLTQHPLCCSEYVKIILTSGKGAWKSRAVKAKVNIGLPVPLILGMPFLSAEHIVIDINAHMAIDKRNGYDIVNPVIHPARVWKPEYVVPPPTPKKIHTPPHPLPSPSPSRTPHLLPDALITLL
ncbi:hypothetical protein BDQ17DRAFT_1393824 [Cyathus striatus]|nr:hypothetical protein BDQ17DRAFT_1393824 [Cyathus striatus]